VIHLSKRRPRQVSPLAAIVMDGLIRASAVIRELQYFSGKVHSATLAVISISTALIIPL
jgi:hypothetical protein